MIFVNSPQRVYCRDTFVRHIRRTSAILRYISGSHICRIHECYPAIEFKDEKARTRILVDDCFTGVVVMRSGGGHRRERTILEPGKAKQCSPLTHTANDEM